jgi:hypothetical protein
LRPSITRPVPRPSPSRRCRSSSTRPRVAAEHGAGFHHQRPDPQPHTLWIFWGDSNQPDIIPLGVGAGTFFFQATHRYSIQSFRQHRHKPYTVTAFVLAGSAPAQTLLAGSVVVFQYFPREVASFVNG